MRRTMALLVAVAGLALLIATATPAYADPGGNNDDHPGAVGNPGDNAPGRSNADQPRGNSGSAGGGSAEAQAEGPNSAGAPGASGTTKVHESPQHKNSSLMHNDPRIGFTEATACMFEIHGFGFDASQSGSWWIQAHPWGSGDPAAAVLGGTYAADANGDWTNGPFTLPDGHYKLYVEVTHTAGNDTVITTEKHKVPKVGCPAPTAVSDEQGGGGGGVAAGPAPTQLGVEQAPSGVSPVVETQAGGQVTMPTAVAGVEQAPSAGALAGAQQGPAQQAAQSVAGQEQAPGLAGLPSTSTAPSGSIAGAIVLLLLGAAALCRHGV